MKIITLLVSSLVAIAPPHTSVASASTSGDSDHPQFYQCTVEFPDGTKSGICMEKGEKHYEFLTCSGIGLAYVEPGALTRVDENTCGADVVGFNKKSKE
jgi:hypothetical protein